MRINKTKTVLAAMILCTSMGTQAQWAVYNISDTLYDYFKSMRDYAMNSNLQVISNGQQLQMAQAAQNVVNADYRNRMAMTYGNILQEDDRTRPTYALCAEVSKGQVGVSSMSASMNGSSRGGAGGRPKNAAADPGTHYKPTDTGTIQENIRSDENIAGMVLNNIKNTKTCAKRYGDLCGSADGEYALADVSTLGLLSNSSKVQAMVNPNVPGGMKYDIANYTLDSAGYSAGSQYINVAALSHAPKLPVKEQMNGNYGYIVKYNAITTKLNAAAETLKSMLDMRKAPAKMGEAVSAIWKDTDKSSPMADWGDIFPSMKKPDEPSFYEFLNFRIMADVFGKRTIASATGGSDSETLKGIQSKIAINNLISWEQYNQQEKTNILLSHILVQLTTPASKSDLDAEYQKMTSVK